MEVKKTIDENGLQSDRTINSNWCRMSFIDTSMTFFILDRTCSAHGSCCRCLNAHTRTHIYAHTFTHTQNDQQSITNTNCSINADTMVVHETRVGESIRRVRGLQVETVLSGTEHIINTEKKRNLNGAHCEM